MLVVVPHCLAFGWNETGVEPIQLQIILLLEKLFYLLVLLIKGNTLCALWRCPAVLNLLATKHNQLEVVAQKTQTLECTRLQPNLSLAATARGCFVFHEISEYSLKIYNDQRAIHHGHPSPEKLSFS